MKSRSIGTAALTRRFPIRSLGSVKDTTNEQNCLGRSREYSFAVLARYIEPGSLLPLRRLQLLLICIHAHLLLLGCGGRIRLFSS